MWAFCVCARPGGRLSTLSRSCPHLTPLHVSPVIACEHLSTPHTVLIGNRNSSHCPERHCGQAHSRSPISSIGDMVQLCFMIFFFRARRPPPSAPARPFF